ncbi:Transcription factor VOZ1 [Apostasia shenzhenica]|uniref:Transcription factor VOZ1 n=1 Tax=Apostasia shenzhenica TaxID=1088818 RepID=A0A2H9ZZN3_9ASPA|nr:Transcription factor VOZ1 [Apostasia shenzhenica]
MSKGCRSASHALFKDKAKNRVDDLQCMFSDLLSARRENRTGDVAVLEEQVNQMLREWKAELNEASPATSALVGNSRVSSDLSSEIRRLLQLGEEDDDATSKLADHSATNLKAEPLDAPDAGVSGGQGETAVFHESFHMNQELQQHEIPSANDYKTSFAPSSGEDVITQMDYQQFNLQQLQPNHYIGLDDGGQAAVNLFSHFSDLLPTICPPPSAFLRAKCALWDCPRPTQGSEWCPDYCSSFHATLAFNEGLPGMNPVLRPGGIDLKDGPLFAALSAKTQGKEVGIPECEGAATTKSPWNAPELFDLSVLEGESLREWLFFDKPRRAFESGNRRQRSLPDYSGRGWHESRKQVVKEYGGLKRSYYMDPQPSNHYEWHLFEYEISNCDACALYRLELKLVDHKKGGKAKSNIELLVDLQQQMDKLTAEHSSDKKRHLKGRAKDNDEVAEFTASDVGIIKENSLSAYHEEMVSTQENPIYGPHLPYGYTIESLNNYYDSDLNYLGDGA